MHKKIYFILILLFTHQPTQSVEPPTWGFFAHQLINRQAVFSLPPEMIDFYKYHINYIAENSVNPDKRRYVVEDEGAKHYIDLDLYGDSAAYTLPRYWFQAVAQYGEDSLMAWGIVPWHVNFMKIRLTKAFAEKNATEILRLSAEIGHYIADANVPLHTTSNYNGKATNQVGIHAFWESRVPELLSKNYDFFVGKAQYIDNPQLRAWDAVIQANEALDSVYYYEKFLTKKFSEDKKYGFEERNKQTVKVYSKEFTRAYEKKLNGQIERQLRSSIKMIADFWYTAWVDAGQPDIAQLLEKVKIGSDSTTIQKETLEWRKDNIAPGRVHEH